jgi:hypothetical protein
LPFNTSQNSRKTKVNTSAPLSNPLFRSDSVFAIYQTKSTIFYTFKCGFAALRSDCELLFSIAKKVTKNADIVGTGLPRLTKYFVLTVCGTPTTCSFVRPIPLLLTSIILSLYVISDVIIITEDLLAQWLRAPLHPHVHRISGKVV